ncbi:hypothetical protein [Trujillonella humicola]|uniref:hypothetical protein n=1 Tax=Trujillonella humicola TaxID=3383699 RepID=UPI003905A327
MQRTDGTASAVEGTERRRRSWRLVTAHQLTLLCRRADGSDPAARDAAARAARLAALLEADARGSLVLR